MFARRLLIITFVAGLLVGCDGLLNPFLSTTETGSAELKRFTSEQDLAKYLSDRVAQQHQNVQSPSFHIDVGQFGIILQERNADNIIVGNDIRVRDGGSAAIDLRRSGTDVGGEKTLISGNRMDGQSAATRDGIRADSQINVQVTGNMITGFVDSIDLNDTDTAAADWVISNNYFWGNTNDAPSLLGSNHIEFGNVEGTGNQIIRNALGGIDFLRLNDATRLLIATGVITVTQSFHTIDGEGAADDILVTINGGSAGDKITIKPDDGAVTITIADTGNIILAGDADFVMSDIADMWEGIFDGTNWLETSRSLNHV